MPCSTLGETVGERLKPMPPDPCASQALACFDLSSTCGIGFWCDQFLGLCRPGLWCGHELFDRLRVELPKCVPEFYKLCDFDRLIRICPFDPAWDAFDWKQKALTDRLQELEVQVKELQAKLPTRK